MTSRAIARTLISFGLVSVPVAVYKATDSSTNGFELHQYDRDSGSRIRYQKVRESDGAQVEASDIVKGAEVGGEVVMITDADLAELAEFVPAARSMEVQAFVPAEAVDPMSLSGVSYYVAPDGKVKGGAKAYKLLAGALRRSGRRAVVVWGLRGREYPFVLHADHGVIVAQQLHWPSQVRPAPEVEDVAVGCTEEDLADKLVAALAADKIELAESDQYSVALSALISAKAEGGSLGVPPERPAPAGADLTAVLMSSLDSLRGKQHDIVQNTDSAGYTGAIVSGRRS